MVFPRLVQIRKHRGSSRLVTPAQNLLNSPVGINGRPRGYDRPKSILQTLPILGCLPDFDIGHKTKHGSSPVGTPPGVCLVETLVSRTGLAVGHSMNHAPPYLDLRQLASLSARDRFDIASQALLKPVRFIRKRSKRQVDEFMRHRPILIQIASGYAAIQPHLRQGLNAIDVSPGGAMNLLAITPVLDHLHSGTCDRKSPVINCHGAGSFSNPFQDVFCLETRTVLTDIDLYLPSSDLQDMPSGAGPHCTHGCWLKSGLERRSQGHAHQAWQK